jgi:hypothetical protein
MAFVMHFKKLDDFNTGILAFNFKDTVYCGAITIENNFSLNPKMFSLSMAR